MAKLNISELSKAEVLAALYNRAKPQGLGFLHYDPKPMSVEEAQEEIDNGPSLYFDYFKGRVMKVDLSGPELATGLYDRDNGQGAAAEALRMLMVQKDINPIASQEAHQSNTRESAEDAQTLLATETTIEPISGGATRVKLGMDDMADYLKPILNEVLKK